MKKLVTVLLILGGIAVPAFAQIVQPVYYFGAEGYQKSLELYNQGLLKSAEEQLAETLQRFPESPASEKAALLQSNIDLVQGNFQNADNYLESFIKERDNSPFKAYAAIQRGYIAFEQKKFDKASTLFAEAKKIAEKEYADRADSVYADYAIAALYWRGISLAQQGKYQDAQPVFEEAFRSYPNGIYADDALFALGLISEINRQYDIAINYFRTLAKKYPYSNTLLASNIREINNNLILRDYSTALVRLESVDNVYKHIQSKDSVGRQYEVQNYAEHAGEELIYLRGEANNLAGNYPQAAAVFQSFLDTYTESALINYVRLGAGWAALNMGKYDKAIINYDSVIANVKDEEKIKTLALLYRAVSIKRSGNIDEAKKELAALSVLPGFPYVELVLIELGQIYYEAGDYDNAARVLERADREAREALSSVRIHLLLGATYLEQKKWAKAVSEYKSAEQLALKSSPVFMPQKDWYISESRLKLGIALVKNSRTAEAIPPLLAFIGDNKKDPRMETALFWLAEAYYRKDLLNNAAETYQAMLDHYPASELREEALYGLGWSYFRQKEFSKSSATFDQMVKEFPNSKYGVEVLTRQGDGYYVTRNYKNAAEAYRKASRLAPNTEEGQYSAYQLCHALYKMASFEDAITALLNFVKTYPRSPYAPNALYLNGWIRFQQKKYSEAVDDFKFLIQAYPNSSLLVRAHFAIGDAEYNMGNYDAAIASYKTIVESYPSSPLAPEAVKSIQYSYMALGKTQEALDIADKFVQTNPNSPFAEEFRFKKGEMFFTGKNYKDAVSEYDNFIKNYPESDKNAEALYWMGKSYVNLNDLDKADQSFRTLQKKYPKSEYAPIGMLELALLEKQRNNIEKADSLFKGLQDKYPDNQAAAQAGFERAVIKYSTGDTTGAIELFRNVAEKYKGMEYADQSLYRIAMFLRMKGSTDSAKAEFAKLAERVDNPLLAAEAQFRIGEIHMRANKFDDAIKAFNLVKEKFAGYEDWYSLALLDMGECHERTGNFEAALENYRALETLRPEDDFGNTAKRRIKQIEKK